VALEQYHRGEDGSNADLELFNALLKSIQKQWTTTIVSVVHEVGFVNGDSGNAVRMMQECAEVLCQIAAGNSNNRIANDFHHCPKLVRESRDSRNTCISLPGTLPCQSHREGDIGCCRRCGELLVFQPINVVDRLE
jgi:hypothetical protein